MPHCQNCFVCLYHPSYTLYNILLPLIYYTKLKPDVQGLCYVYWKCCFLCFSAWVTVMRTMLTQSARLSSSSSSTVFGRWLDRSVKTSETTDPRVQTCHSQTEPFHKAAHNSHMSLYLWGSITQSYHLCSSDYSSQQPLSSTSCSWSQCWTTCTAVCLERSSITVSRSGQPRYSSVSRCSILSDERHIEGMFWMKLFFCPVQEVQTQTVSLWSYINR